MDTDIETMMHNQFWWRDGHAGGMWLGGTHIAGWSEKHHNWKDQDENWVVSGKNKPDLDHVELLNADFNRTIQVEIEKYSFEMLY